MLNWFKRSSPSSTPLPVVDLHSHLLAGLDDGVQTIDEAVAIIKEFQSLGYKRLFTTPHVMSDFYRNTPEGIMSALSLLRAELKEQAIPMDIYAAAEYYLDEGLMTKVQQKEKLLTLGDQYLLFETNFMTEPLNLKEFIFALQTSGYRPILAHPERYLFLQNDMDKVEDLFNRGVLFQLNISSLSGYYSKGAQQLANKLVSKGWVHFIGSDCHNMKHMELLKQAVRQSNFQKVLNLPLLNNHLLEA